MKRLIAVLPLLLMITACDQAPPSADPSVLTERTEAWVAAMEAKDVDALVMLYTSDTRLLPPNGEMMTGRDAVRSVFGGLLDAGISADLTSIETRVSGDVGYDVGTYVMMAGDEVIDTGKFIETFHRGEDGVWRMTNDIWNSDLPVAAAPMAEDAPMDEEAPMAEE